MNGSVWLIVWKAINSRRGGEAEKEYKWQMRSDKAKDKHHMKSETHCYRRAANENTKGNRRKEMDQHEQLNMGPGDL